MSEYNLLNREVELKDRTPVTQAVEIIMILDGMWLTDFNGDMSHKPALNRLFKLENVDAAALKKSLLSSTNYDQKTSYLGFLLVISAYCVQAIGEYMDNNEIPTNLAWAYVCEAWRELSMLDYARTRLASEKQIPNLIQSAIIERESNATNSLWAIELVASAMKARASKGGKARAAKDPKTQALRQIEEVEYPLKKHLFHLRGRRNEFVIEMQAKYPVLVSKDSIERLVDRLNKQNGITQKKQSKPIATQLAK
jgi:hypothetical protein